MIVNVPDCPSVGKFELKSDNGNIYWQPSDATAVEAVNSKVADKYSIRITIPTGEKVVISAKTMTSVSFNCVNKGYQPIVFTMLNKDWDSCEAIVTTELNSSNLEFFEFGRFKKSAEPNFDKYSIKFHNRTGSNEVYDVVVTGAKNNEVFVYGNTEVASGTFEIGKLNRDIKFRNSYRDFFDPAEGAFYYNVGYMHTNAMNQSGRVIVSGYAVDSYSGSKFNKGFKLSYDIDWEYDGEKECSYLVLNKELNVWGANASKNWVNNNLGLTLKVVKSATDGDDIARVFILGATGSGSSYDTMQFVVNIMGDIFSTSGYYLSDREYDSSQWTEIIPVTSTTSVRVPECTTADNGKVLKVVSGAPTWSST